MMPLQSLADEVSVWVLGVSMVCQHLTTLKVRVLLLIGG